MDQIKIGTFLKALRNKKNLTQEQLAEKFGVSQRSVSRWENGNTMPDISILIELADYYEIELREILNGERSNDNMDKELKDTLIMLADYTEKEKVIILKKMFESGLTSAFSLTTIFVIYVFNLHTKNQMFDELLLDMIFIGIVTSVITMLSSLKLTGKIGKKLMKKVVRISLIVSSVLIIGILITMFILLGIK